MIHTLVEGQHRYKGFNLLSEKDALMFRLLAHGRFVINGFTNNALPDVLSDLSSAQVSRLLKRLRVFKLIKKVGKRYKYYLTDFGRLTIITVLKLRELHVIPALAHATPEG